MQTLQSTKPPFRYHWNFGPTPPAYLAASRVITFDFSDPEFVERCKESVVRISPPNKSGSISLKEMGPRWMNDASALLGNAMSQQGIDLSDTLADLDPTLVLLHDQVSFHHDMPMWTCVFGAWMLEGPERTLRFPLMDLEVPFRPGTVVLFDPAQPHGLLRSGATEYIGQDDAASYPASMVSFMCSKKSNLGTLLGIETYDPAVHADVPHTVDKYKACPRTGAVEFR